MSCCGGKKDPILGISDACCTSETGCGDFNRRNLNDVKVEPIYVQKVYDAALIQTEAMIGGSPITLTPKLASGSTIVSVVDIRCRRYNGGGCPTLELCSDTSFQGATEVCSGLVGPDGMESQTSLYVDTKSCDEKCKGTPIYGKQTISIDGYVIVEVDVMVRKNCGNKCKVTLSGRVDVCGGSINQMKFFELCVPSTTGGAFLPRFTEFCNVNCEARLVTNSLDRDITISPCGEVEATLLVALCISCEKKIVVPVQLCVLSTGFPQLSPSQSSICNSYPSLFPNQTDPASVEECLDALDDNDDKHCHKPDNRPGCRGLSISDDESDNIV